MKVRFARCALLAALCALASACGPSKETMCAEIAAEARKTAPGDTNLEAERYIKCLNASNDWVKTTYKEIKAKQKK